MTPLTFTKEAFSLGNDPRYPAQSLWLLRGPQGVVQFKAGRHRHEPGACDHCREFADISHFDSLGNCWISWDLGYHSPVPRYEGQEPITTKDQVCDVLQMEADCYYDGTGLGAAELLNAFLASDCSEDFLREELTGWYRRWLVDEGETCASPVTLLTEAIRRADQ